MISRQRKVADLTDARRDKSVTRRTPRAGKAGGRPARSTDPAAPRKARIAKPTVLLDRDGVINADRPASVCTLEDFELLPGVGEAIALLNRKGYQVLIVTNQACVGRGDLQPNVLEEIHRNMRQALAMDGASIAGIYVCPHVDEDRCDCRKPQPGLIDRAHRDFGFERPVTWMVGDSERDVEAAWNAGCRAALVRSGKPNTGQYGDAVPVFGDLAHFAHELEPERVLP